MRSLRAIVLMVPMLAFAGWRPVGNVAPIVTEVQVADAGVVFATSSVGGAIAWQVTDAGVTTLNTLAGGFVGGGYYAPNCLLGLSGLGNIVATTGCGAGTSLGSGSWRSIKLLSSPPRAVAVRNSPPDAFWAGPGANAGWVQVSAGIGASASSTLQTREIQGIDYTAMNTGIGLRMSVDGGAAIPVANTNSWSDAVPFPLAGRPAVLGLTPTAFILIADYRTPVNTTPTIPAALLLKNVAMSRFTGMATTTTGVLLAPIPNPARVAETWVVRPGPTGESFTDKIHCIDDRYCATSNAAGDVWLWTNDVAPAVSMVPPVIVAGQPVRFFADAGDGDGDPIYVSWDAGVGTWSNVAGVNDGTQIDFTLPRGICTPTLEVWVTDGLSGHERTIQLPLTVIDPGAIEASGASTPPIAGGPAVSFSAVIDGGCSPAVLSWSASDGQSGNGATFMWTPPATECNSDGGIVTVTTTATWPVVAPTSVSQQFRVKPWGAPEQPAFTSPATQLSGTTRDYVPDGGHLCSTRMDFPGTQLIWAVDAGAVPFSLVGGALRLDPPNSCVTQQVTATARREVVGEADGRSSPAGTLVVNITPNPPAITASTPFSITAEGDAGVLFGLLRLDAGCDDQRDLSVNVMVFSAGAFVIDGGFRPQDGTWSLVPGGCAGGTYDVVAELYEDGGLTVARDQGTVTLPSSPIKLGAQSINRIDVACGAGARGAVSLLPEPNACSVADVTWRATNGPALVTMSGAGDTLELQTEALDFSVVGQQVTLEWSADAGAGNGDVVSHSIELAVQPFLEVMVKAQPPLRREDEAVTLEITLKNTTACAVEGVSVTLPLSGGSPIPESVLLENVHAQTRLSDEGLVVDGVSVAAQGSAVIQLSARSRLLSSPSVQPVASLNGYVVSTVPPVGSPATGCGCSQVEVSALFGALVLLFRRKRSS